MVVGVKGELGDGGMMAFVGIIGSGDICTEGDRIEKDLPSHNRMVFHDSTHPGCRFAYLFSIRGKETWSS